MAHHNKAHHSEGRVTLARYGGIGKCIKQKGNFGRFKNDEDNEMTYHEAPERYGYYAFIYPYIELFLLGSPVNKKGKKNTECYSDYVGRFQEKKARVYKKFVATDGTLWTHLKPHKQHMILEEKGSWYKVYVKDFYKVINKAMAIQHGENVGFGFPHGVNGSYAVSNDHLEVFITRDTKINS